MRVAIQGEYGSFSHEAALKMVPQATILACAYSAEVFRLVEEEDAAAVIPIENSLAGSVAEHFDLLFRHEVQIQAESLLRIRHNLIALPGSRVDQILRVSSHPVALAQCRNFLSRHPKMEVIPAYDTAGSVKQLMERRDPDAAAIASGLAASFYQAEVLAASIEDNPANFTRFFLLQNRRQAQPRANSDKVSIAFIVENRPGSLASALQVFTEYQTNLVKIESRPVQGQPWEYVFYVDYQISRPEAVDTMLDSLRQRCLVVKELGRYPAAGPAAADEPASALLPGE